MNSNQKKITSCSIMLLTPIIAFLGYLFSVAILLPLIEDSLSELGIKIVLILSTFLLTIFFVKLFYLEMKDISHLGRKGEYSKGYKSNRKKGLLFFSVLAFALAPFGYAGILEGRGGYTLPSIWGGTLCLVIGIILLSGYFRS